MLCAIRGCKSFKDSRLPLNTTSPPWQCQTVPDRVEITKGRPETFVIAILLYSYEHTKSISRHREPSQNNSPREYLIPPPNRRETPFVVYRYSPLRITTGMIDLPSPRPQTSSTEQSDHFI